MKILTFISFLLFISSCSSINFWSSDEENLEEPRPLGDYSNNIILQRSWSKKFNSDNDLGNFRISFIGKKVAIIDQKGIYHELESASGRVIKSSKLGHEVAVSVVTGYGKIIFADIKGTVYAYSLDDVQLLWSQNIGSEILALPAIDAKGVIIHSSSGEVVSLDQNSGSINWSYRSQLPSLTVRGNSIPLVSEDLVYVTFDNGRISVFDINSGYVVWDGPISYKEGTSELENLIDADSSPVLEGGLVFATNYQGNLTAFDPSQRRPVWNTKVSSFHSPLFIKGLIVVINDDGSISSFSQQTFLESWVNEEYLRRDLSNAIEYKGNIIFGDLEGYLHILDPLNGKTIGRKRISRDPIKHLVRRGESLYVLDKDLQLISLK